jgi:hypothetical protein
VKAVLGTAITGPIPNRLRERRVDRVGRSLGLERGNGLLEPIREEGGNYPWIRLLQMVRAWIGPSPDTALQLSARTALLVQQR